MRFNYIIHWFICTILVYVNFFLAGCSENKASQITATKDVVLIFSKNETERPQYRNVFYTPNSLSYYDDHLLKEEYPLNNTHKSDTLLIETTKDVIQTKLFHNYVTFHYIFQPGDTVIFEFEHDIPLITHINRKTKAHDLNFHYQLKKRSGEMLKGSNTISVGPKKTPPVEQTVDSIYKQFQVKAGFLDSLLAQGAIQDDVYNTASAIVKTELYSQILFRQYYEYAITKLPEMEIREFANQSNYIGQPFYHDFLIWQYLPSELMAIPKVRHAQGISLDYKQGYAKVKDSFAESKVRNWLLFHCLEMLREEGSREQFDSHLALFRTDVRDTLYAAYLDKNYDDRLMDVSGETVLINVLKNRKMEFNDLLEQSLGEVVYIDLWASWCMPCRAAMPASRALHEKYRDQPLRIVYLSLDDKFSNWEKAAQEEGLFGHLNSYLLTNPKQAALLKQIQLKTIPRYLIYNKRGQLVHQNAPGPDSPELIALLDRYLNE